MEEVRKRQAEGKLKLSEKATSSPVRGQHAPDLTNAEYQYLSELVQSKVRVVVKLMNGETVEGWIEYIDRNFIRLTRQGRPNLFIYKHDIKYLEEVKKANGDTRQ
ncbi:MAG: RNA chaperone Hfq [Acidobacteriia bacterium]|nr:RNA chaperone Hfq [Terriglobia bacterium]